MRRFALTFFASNMARLDSVDCTIMRILHEDARTSNADLAHKVSLSPSATLQRVRRLEAGGAIKRYVAEADETLFEPWSRVLIKVTLSAEGQKRRDEFEANIRATREIVEALELAGTPDYMLKGAIPSAANWPALRNMLDPDRALIESVNITAAVRTVKMRAPHPLLLYADAC